jgi:hypothetical protein
MSKTAATILLFVFLFNMIGYRAWFYYAEKKADVSMEAQLDNQQYSENDLVSITIPLYNPYQLDQKNFERVNGEISYAGKTYKFVKRKVSDGNLVLLCIPDAHKMMLKKAKTDYVNNVNDMGGSSKNPTRSGLQKVFSGSDYTIHQYDFQISKYSIFLIVDNGFSISRLSSIFIATPGKPPQDEA